MAFTLAPPDLTGTRVGAPPRVPLERPYSMANGVSSSSRRSVAAANSSPGSVINEPNPKMPYLCFAGG